MRKSYSIIDEYTQRGWSIIPLSEDLIPLIKWKEEALISPTSARREFAAQEQRRGHFPNVAVDLGRSGLILIDLDREYTGADGEVHHPGVDGIAEWELP